MILKNTLHYASYLKWAFLLAATVLIFYSLIALPENLISIIGIIVFLMGIQMGLESLRDIAKMSEREKKFFRNIKHVKTLSTIILSGIAVTVVISLFFLSLKFIFPSSRTSIFNEFFHLGIDCWAFILGLLCTLKSVYDKYNFANQPEILE